MLWRSAKATLVYSRGRDGVFALPSELRGGERGTNAR